MAQETQQIVLSVATGNSDVTLRQLRDNIKNAKDALQDLTVGDAKYNEQLAELTKSQRALKDAMSVGTASMEEQDKAAEGLGKSYNVLVDEMAALKKEFRSTSDAAKQMEIAGKINDINSELKRLDAMQGNFQRNVGNYTNSIKDAFTQAGSAIGGNFAKGVTGANNALKLMAANPIVGVVTILVSLITKLSDAIKGNEEQAQALNKAFSSFNAIGDLVSKMVSKLADGIVWLAEKFSALIGKILGTSDAMEANNKIAEESIELTQKQREATIKNAEAEREIAKLRAQAAEKDRLTGEQRLALLQKASDLEKEISKRALDNAKKEYEIIKAKNALRASSTEDLNKEAEAYAKMVQAETAYYNTSRNLATQMVAARKQMAKEEREEVAAAREERKDALADAQAQLAAEKMLNEVRLSVAKEGTDEYLELQKEKADLEMQAQIANAEKTILNEEDRATAIELIRQATLEKIEALEEQHLAAEADLAFAEVYAHEKMEDEKTKTTRKQIKQRIALGQSYAKATSSLVSSIADIMEGDSAATEEQLKAAKTMRIAGATIDMLSGVVTAISQAQQLGPIAGPIMAAINSATVIAAGVANIQKIKQQSTARNAGSSSATPTPSVPATVAAPVIATQVQTVRQLTTATEEQRLDKMAGDAKVVLVMSDLEAAENDRRVHVEESTF